MKTTEFKEFIRNKYAWPGGYPMYAILGGMPICHSCAKHRAKQVIESTRRNLRDGWECNAIDINYEEYDLTCDDCGQLIESAYGIDVEEE